MKYVHCIVIFFFGIATVGLIDRRLTRSDMAITIVVDSKRITAPAIEDLVYPNGGVKVTIHCDDIAFTGRKK